MSRGAARGTFHSPREVAAMFGVSYHAVLRAIDRGDLEAERVFNRLRISSEALDAYRAARRVAPRPARPGEDGREPPRPCLPQARLGSRSQLATAMNGQPGAGVDVGGRPDPLPAPYRSVR
jgi:excisionase family DNA binding protein